MKDNVNRDFKKLAKRVSGLEYMVSIMNDYLLAMERSFEALDNHFVASNNRADIEIAILLRAVVRLRGLVPQDRTKKGLIRALLEDEFRGTQSKASSRHRAE